jgi:hypothetical protein
MHIDRCTLRSNSLLNYCQQIFVKTKMNDVAKTNSKKNSCDVQTHPQYHTYQHSNHYGIPSLVPEEVIQHMHELQTIVQPNPNASKCNVPSLSKNPLITTPFLEEFDTPQEQRTYNTRVETMHRIMTTVTQRLQSIPSSSSQAAAIINEPPTREELMHITRAFDDILDAHPHYKEARKQWNLGVPPHAPLPPPKRKRQRKKKIVVADLLTLAEVALQEEKE